MIAFERIEGFDWDAGNARKSEEKHGVSQTEAEQVFFNVPLLLAPDLKHSGTWSRAQRVRFPHLKPTTQAISLRLPLSLLEQIKVEANKRDVPYQSLIKVWLAEKAG